jgi:hypothetical protein
LVNVVVVVVVDLGVGRLAVFALLGSLFFRQDEEKLLIASHFSWGFRVTRLGEFPPTNWAIVCFCLNI